MSPPIVSSLAVVRRRAWSSSSSRAVNRRKNRCWPSVSTRSARSPVTVSLIVLVMSSTFLVGVHDARQLSGHFLTALTGYSWHGQHEFADAATAFAVADAPVLAGDGSRRPAGGIAANPAPRRRPAARARLPGRGPARRRGRGSTRRPRRPAPAGAALPPLVLDDDEAVALAIALLGAAQNPVVGSAEASVRALSKVVQVMP